MEVARNLIGTIQEQLQTRMKDKNLTATELGRKAGLSSNAVRHILNGDSTNPGIESLSAISKLLDCSVDELIGRPTSQTYMSTVAELNKGKTKHTWNSSLYQSCSNEIQNHIQSKNYKPSLEQVLFFIKETYIYAIEGGSNTADLRFTKWIVDSHCK
jgi:transcriptional regulator with XRE-family HTH domain